MDSHRGMPEEERPSPFRGTTRESHPRGPATTSRTPMGRRPPQSRVGLDRPTLAATGPTRQSPPSVRRMPGACSCRTAASRGRGFDHPAIRPRQEGSPRAYKRKAAPCPRPGKTRRWRCSAHPPAADVVPLVQLSVVLPGTPAPEPRQPRRNTTGKCYRLRSVRIRERPPTSTAHTSAPSTDRLGRCRPRGRNPERLRDLVRPATLVSFWHVHYPHSNDSERLEPSSPQRGHRPGTLHSEPETTYEDARRHQADAIAR